MENKNPYEIRLSLLNMAKDMLDRQNDLQMQFTYELIEQAKDACKPTEDFLEELYEMHNPKSYTYDPVDIVNKATELYAFVTKKG